MTPAAHNPDTREKLAICERPATRSVIEEVVGVLWALLATLSPLWPVSAIAWFMAAVSLGASIIYAVAALRARANPEEKPNDV